MVGTVNGTKELPKLPWELTSQVPAIVEEPPIPMDVPAGALNVDTTYQALAPRNPKLIKEIGAHFDLTLFGRLRVARRPNGALFVMDGRHRLEGAKKAGVELIPCDVYDVPERKREIEIFITSNTRIRKVPQGMLFMAEVAAGQEDAVNLNRLVHEAGLAIVDSNNARAEFTVPKMTCIAALKSLYGHGTKSYARRAAPVEHWQLREALDLISGIAPPNALVTEHIVIGMTWLVQNHPLIRTQADRLRAIGWSRLDMAARAVGPRPVAKEAGEALLAVIDWKRPKGARIAPGLKLPPPPDWLPAMAG
jgi:hypothetical protein